MPDVRTLLHDAALKPLGPLDMVAVRARARRHSLRRIVAGVAGLAALITVGAPVGNLILAPADQGQRIESIGPEPSGKNEATIDGRVETGADVSTGAVDVTAPASLEVPAREQTPDRSTPTTVPSGDYPPATQCSVDNQELGDRQQRSCRFTATSAGGWNYYQPPDHLPSIGSDIPSASVIVTRDGRATRYQTRIVGAGGQAGEYHIEGCADSIIQPGDLVDVVITQSSAEYVDTQMGVGAGQHWGCTESGP